jgi:hypothetical protein
VDYLNQHKQILVCMERFKYVPDRVRPEWLTFENIPDYEPGQGRKSGAQTNVPRQYHADLVLRKDPAELRWIGDKYPNYVRHLEMLWHDNPGAKFIFTHRPIEEVAESHEARSKNPDDPWLGGKNGFEIGIEQWNDSLKRTRDFIESSMNPSALIVSYHDFFYRNEECIPLISHFLEVEIGESTREAWREMSRGFEGGRRPKESLSEEQAAMIEERKDHETERWILDRIAKQRENVELSNRTEGRRHVAQTGEPRELVSAAFEVRSEAREQARKAELLRGQVESLQQELKVEKQKAKRLNQSTRNLSRRAEGLEGQVTEIESSRGWRLLTRLGALRARMAGRP